jgi:hypothetical protein
MKKDQAVNNIDSLDNFRIKPTVPFIGSYLRRGYTQAQIARISNNSPQCINNFIKRHYDELAPLVDDTDNIMTVKAKHIASKAQDKINDILAVDKFDKKDLVPLNIVSGTHTDKYRLLSDKSTQNVSMAVNDANIAAQDKYNKVQAEANEVIRQKLLELTGDVS